jgi:hypothetical protein
MMTGESLQELKVRKGLSNKEFAKKLGIPKHTLGYITGHKQRKKKTVSDEIEVRAKNVENTVADADATTNRSWRTTAAVKAAQTRKSRRGEAKTEVKVRGSRITVAHQLGESATRFTQNFDVIQKLRSELKVRIREAIQAAEATVGSVASMSQVLVAGEREDADLMNELRSQLNPTFNRNGQSFTPSAQTQ